MFITIFHIMRDEKLMMKNGKLFWKILHISKSMETIKAKYSTFDTISCVTKFLLQLQFFIIFAADVVMMKNDFC